MVHVAVAARRAHELRRTRGNLAEARIDVAIAATALGRVRGRLLLLDEVMAGLNPSEIIEIIAIIRKIRDSGVTVLLIEHVMHAVMSLSDHIYVLSYGKIIAEGTPQQVVNNQAVIEAYLGRGSTVDAGAAHA